MTDFDLNLIWNVHIGPHWVSRPGYNIWDILGLPIMIMDFNVLNMKREIRNFLGSEPPALPLG